MSVRALSWSARAVPAERLPEVRAMAAALGLEVVAATDDLVTLRTERGDVLEYCAPGAPVPDHLFAHGGTVLGFEVDDLDATAAALERAGFAALSGTTRAGDVRFRHVLGGDGAVYGLIERASGAAPDSA